MESTTSTIIPGRTYSDEIINAAISPAPPLQLYPELRKADWDRKYGRYDFHRFDHLTSGHASVGGASLGKVDVDCRFLFKQSKWGVIDGETPAGIIYMDIDIHPRGKECSLSWAAVEVTVEDYGDSSVVTSNVQLSEYFGPEHIVGPERTMHKTKKVSLQPEVEAMGIGVGGVGTAFETSFDFPHRWEFRGQLIPPKPKYRTLGYTTLEWKLKDSELEPGQQNKVHTAFTFEHGTSGIGFLMKVKVRGGLRKMHHRFANSMRKLKFGPRLGKDEDIATTLIGKYDGPRRPLDVLARGLKHDMERKNQLLRPLELPGPQRAIFYEAPVNTQDTAAQAVHGTQSGTEQTPTFPPPQRVSSNTVPALPEATPSTVPVELQRPPATQSATHDNSKELQLRELERVARALLFPNPGFPIAPPEPTERPPSSSGTPTLFEQTEEPAVPDEPKDEKNAEKRDDVREEAGDDSKGTKTQGQVLRRSETDEVAELQMALSRTVRIWALLMYRILFQLLGIGLATTGNEAEL